MTERTLIVCNALSPQTYRIDENFNLCLVMSMLTGHS